MREPVDDARWREDGFAGVLGHVGKQPECGEREVDIGRRPRSTIACGFESEACGEQQAVPNSYSDVPATSRNRNPLRRLSTEHPAIVKVGRVGWFAKGVVYLMAGFLMLAVAAEASGWSKAPVSDQQEASPTGAIKTVASSTGGTLLLVLLATGMLLYAAWRVVSALLPGGTDAEAILHRLGYVVSAIAYSAFAVSALALARNSSEDPDGNTQVTDMSESVMSHTAGRLVIGAVGVIVICVGLYRMKKGFSLDVNDELNLGGLPPTRLRWTKRLGAVGEIGRGIGFGLVGFFLVRSAVSYVASEATGLDGALRRVATEPWGVFVVVIVGVGFVAYGAFCLLTFTRRRLQAP